MIRCFLVSILVLLGNSIQSQSNSYTLSQVISYIESNTDYVFNYNVHETDAYSIELAWDNYSNIASIKSLFERTSFDIKVNGNQIIVLPLIYHEYNICGSILDSDGDPLIGSNIITSKSTGTQTDENGQFQIQLSVPKKHQIEISYLGYQTIMMSVDDLVDCPEIRMDMLSESTKGVIIIGNYINEAIRETQSYNGINVDSDDIRQDPLRTDHDVLTSIQNIPGINSPDESATNLNIRGSSYDHNLILWEGVPLYDQGHLFGMISSINPFSLRGINVYKSIYAPQYENRIGGIIDLRLQEEQQLRTKGSFGANFLDSHLSLATPLIKNKVSLVLGGRLSTNSWMEGNHTLDNYTSKLFDSYRNIDESEESEDEEIELDISFYDLNAKLIFDVSDKLKIQSSVFSANNQFKYFSEIDGILFNDLDTLSTHNLALSVIGDYIIDKRSKIRLAFTHSDYRSDYFFERNNNDTGIPENFNRVLENNVRDQQLKIEYEKSFPSYKINAGYILDQKELGFFLNQQGTYEQTIDSYINTQSTFHHTHANIHYSGKRISWDAGLRLSYADIYNRWNFSPRMNARYKLWDNLNLKVYTGQFHQYIRQFYQAAGSDLSLVNNAWFLDENEESQILQSFKIGIGAIYRKKDWIIDIDLYNHFSDGISSLNSASGSIIEIEDQGQLRSKGIELMVKKDFGKLSSILNYTLSSTQATFPALFDEEEEDETDFFPANNDQRHQLSWITNLKFSDFKFIFAANYKTGLPYTDPDELVFLEEEDDEEYYEFDYESINDNRLSDYVRLDASVVYQKELGPLNLELSASVYNIHNRVNVLSRDFFLSNQDDSDQDPEIIEVEKINLRRTGQLMLRIYW